MNFRLPLLLTACRDSSTMEGIRVAVRSLNQCEGCGYTWYPRGHAKSARCPSCKSPRVVTHEEVQAARTAKVAMRDELVQRLKIFGPAEMIFCPVCHQRFPAGEMLFHYDKFHEPD